MCLVILLIILNFVVAIAASVCVVCVSGAKGRTLPGDNEGKLRPVV